MSSSALSFQSFFFLFYKADSNQNPLQIEYTESLSILLKGDSGFGIGFKNYVYRKEISYKKDLSVYEKEIINFKALEFSFSFS